MKGRKHVVRGPSASGVKTFADRFKSLVWGEREREYVFGQNNV